MPKADSVKSRFVGSTATLMTGVVGGQAIVIVSSPILTRVFSPEDFGVLAVYSAVMGIVSIVAGLRYESAIPLPRQDSAALSVLCLSFVCVATIALLCAVVILGAGKQLAAAANVPSLSPLLWLLPLSVGLAGTYQALHYWSTRKGLFKSVATTRLTQSTSMVAIQLFSGLMSFGAPGLVVGHVVGQSVGIMRLFRNVDASAMRRSFTVGRLRAVAWRFRRLPMFASWSSLLNVVSSQLPVLALASLFAPGAAGLYMLAQRVASQPMSLIGTSVGHVFFADAAKARRDGSVAEYTETVFLHLLKIGSVPIALAAVSAPQAFRLLFGEEWVDAGTYLRWLSPWLVIQFAISPLSKLSFVYDRQRGELVLQGAMLAARVAAFATGAYLGGVMLCVALFGLASAAVAAINGVWILGLAGVPSRNLVKHIAFEAAAVLACVILAGCVGVLLDSVAPAYSLLLGALAAAGCIVPVRMIRLARDRRTSLSNFH